MKKLFIIILFSAGLLTACQKSISPVYGPRPVTFSVTIENSGDETKSPYTLTVPTAKDSLTAAIWASTTKGSYEGTQKKEPNPDSTNVVDYHNSTCFTSGTRQLLDHQLFYPYKDGHNTDSVFFVAFCPRSQDGWAVEQAAGQTKHNVARFQFDGKTDVMFAQERGNCFDFSSRDLSLSFRHVLTWLRFNVVADEDAIEAWGKVKKITIHSNNVIKINVTKNTCEFSQEDKSFPTYITHKGNFTNTEFEDQAIELTTSAQEVAYTLCGAVNASAGGSDNEYTVDIETEYRPSTTVAINLKAANGSNFAGLTEGKQFTVTLRFKLGDNITTSATVSEWKNGGIGVAPIEEK